MGSMVSTMMMVEEQIGPSDAKKKKKKEESERARERDSQKGVRDRGLMR
jgi:hypothetical protein